MVCENLLDDFDISGLDLNNTVVRCSTQDEADTFLEYLYAKGVWNNKQVDNLSKLWSRHGCSTCYHLSDQKWCYDSWYEEYHPEICIVDFCDIYTKTRMSIIPEIRFSYDELFG